MLRDGISAVTARLASAGSALTYRPLSDTRTLAIRAAGAGRRRTASAAGRAGLALLDGALRSGYADEAVAHVLDSPVAERAVERALSGGLVDATSRYLVRFEVVERIAAEVLTGPALDRTLDRLDISGAGQAVADRILAEGVAEQVATRLLEGPELGRVVAMVLESERADALLTGTLESPGTQRMLARVLESRVVDDAVARIAEDVIAQIRTSEAMWTLVDDIAQSPSVSEAITQQGAGLADQMAEEIRERSRVADDRLERVARRVLRRSQRPGGDEASPAT